MSPKRNELIEYIGRGDDKVIVAMPQELYMFLSGLADPIETASRLNSLEHALRIPMPTEVPTE